LIPFGEAIGIVDVGGGGAVLVGGGVFVTKVVGMDKVAVEVGNSESVGVSVTTGVPVGKLQASMARMSASTGNKIRILIISPLR
jgi:hypothetical protein